MPLARAFVADAARKIGRTVSGFTSQAAQKVDIGEATLYRKIKQFGDS